MQGTQVWSLGLEDPLKKEMAIHSSVLVWEIPWTEDPGGLQSMVATRVENALMTKPRTSLLWGAYHCFFSMGSFWSSHKVIGSGFNPKPPYPWACSLNSTTGSFWGIHCAKIPMSILLMGGCILAHIWFLVSPLACVTTNFSRASQQRNGRKLGL